ncbi:MAG: hypothetical protein JXA69_07615 [Phycisphaerae bacterium]|nr:hypothetical protein [Phycisphaerae bacterium]
MIKALVKRSVALLSIVLSGAVLAQDAPSAQPGNSMMWVDAGVPKPDTYAAFRGRFTLPAATEVELRTLGSSWFVVWLDGKYLTEGPARFDALHPEYQRFGVTLPAGRHVLAVQVHHIGATTRMLMDMRPFLYCHAYANGNIIAIRWKCAPLGGYRPQVRRINPQLGWIEWCDTRQNPVHWQASDFDDSAWTEPVDVTPGIGERTAATIAPVKHFVHALKPIAEGRLAEHFGYEFDDVPARFFLRNLTCDDVPAQGRWRRYDLGRVRLGRPRFVLDLPAGAVIEFAYAEAMEHGRVAPYITLSTGPSCNLDHYVARGGVQEFFPLTPKGGRFLEVHVLADPSRIRFVNETYVERCYHDVPEGSFTCGDPLLEQIWMTGVETYRACAEDALVDNPTRERGQWTGDVVSAGMDIGSVAYADLRLFRRGLVQSARCAREDGLVAGLCPGGAAYLATYAAQWFGACMHYYELTGDRALLAELLPYARRNLAAFEKFITDDGLTDGAGWVFVDWGYVRNPGPVDIAYNLHFVAALRAFMQWCDVLDCPDDAARFKPLEQRLTALIRRWLAAHLADDKAGWPAVGYHTAVLALRLGVVEASEAPPCLAYIKQHILNCFPNNPEAPRLSSPSADNRQLITPYFAHYAFPALIAHGEMDFVLDQYRKCWGWALGEGRTTWVEVFDTRWTHCHQWAGCPTWQLSRYVLGLHARFDLGVKHYVLKLIGGSLPGAEGAIPLPEPQGLIRVKWTRQPDGIHYALQTDAPIVLHRDSADGPVETVSDRYEIVLPR